MKRMLRRLIASVTVGRERLSAIREFYARAAYPNFGLGSVARNAPVGIGSISREPNDWWRRG